MPLRDHFRSPLDDVRRWEGLHYGWPMMMVAALRHHLPRRYIAEPGVHSGSSIEIDVATFEREDAPALPEPGGNGPVAVAAPVWTVTLPTLAAATDLMSHDEYTVRVYDRRRQQRLVAAVEIVSPRNKDRPESRHAFVTKCAAMLREQVCVAIVDVVTTRTSNLYAELLEEIGLSDPALAPEPPALYAAACRLALPDGAEEWRLEAWLHPLALGRPLPTLPLWLARNLAVPLELDASYEQSCEILGIA